MPIILTGLAVLICDFFLKWIVRSGMDLNESIPILEGIFHITYIMNPGAAFGLLRGQVLFFIIVTVAVIAVILYLGSTLQDKPIARWAAGLQLGGAAGNLVDRLRWGAVVDYLDFRVWPVFNLADVSIVVGAGLLIIYLFRSEQGTEGAD